jgi:hypothetical protein
MLRAMPGRVLGWHNIMFIIFLQGKFFYDQPELMEAVDIRTIKIITWKIPGELGSLKIIQIYQKNNWFLNKIIHKPPKK